MANSVPFKTRKKTRQIGPMLALVRVILSILVNAARHFVCVGGAPDGK
jgi:tetrahydromethanopterin S-methyltransferase subunit D